MKAMVFHEHGGVEKLRLEDFPDPEVGPKDALIRVRALSLNGFDPMILNKTTALRTPLPMVPCGDAAGEIVALGAEAEGGWKTGDRVSIHGFVQGEGMTGETRLGVASELIRIPAASLVRMPDALSFEDAACLPIAYGTALRMMVTRGRVKAGEKVLVLGATGGVGVCCVQLAKAAGAEVIACGSSDWKMDRLREIGADHVIDTSQDDFMAWIHEKFGKPNMWGGGGVDMCINYIAGDNWVRACRTLTPGGRMLTCGATAGYDTPNDVRYIWTYELNLMGSNGWTLEDQARMQELVVEGTVKPVKHAVRPLEELPRAMQELIDREVFGKSVIVL